MPYSDTSNDEVIKRYIEKLKPATVMDIGPGAGKYGRIIRGLDYQVTYLDAVEVWAPYVGEFGLGDVYDNVKVEDVRNLSAHDFDYDLVIFGDILEHMTKEDAIGVWERSNLSGARLISIPIVHYPQGHSHGNPYEEHVKDDWSVDEVLETFDVELLSQSDITAVFVR